MSTDAQRRVSPKDHDGSSDAAKLGTPEFAIPQDLSIPLVWKVHKLGEDYISWVHRPVAGSPVFFGGALELLTKAPWYCVPCLWLPLVGWGVWRSLAIARRPLADVFSYFLIGVALWQCLEYSIHRFIFHHAPKGPLGITAHFLFHGCHHKFPTDEYRLVFPPVPAGLGIGAIYLALRTVLPPHMDLQIGAGALFGYVCYDMLHYIFHHSPIVPGGVLKRLKTKHLSHHYKEPTRGYHISGDLMDVLFGTL